MIDIVDLTEDQTISKSNNLNSLELLSFLGALIFIILIYSPVMVNAFNGDDFVHLKWLSEAVKQPELVWRNFHSAWLDITTAKFYRPLISLFMLADYTIWRGNGIGFHLTNVLCHLANTYFLWLILKRLPLGNDKSKWNYIWCLSAATLFGLYPLHPEAVSWITGRVDTFVTLFSLVSFYGYIRWSQLVGVTWKTYNKWFSLSVISMALALLCKEMAIVLPAVFCAYEFIIGSQNLEIGAKCLSVFKKTGLFWLLLLLYFGLRYYALGTLVGGYDNTLLNLDNVRGLISAWRRSLYVFFFPFNETLISKQTPIIFIWAGLLIINLGLIVKSVFVERKNIATFTFLVSWLVLSLIPVYKLFNIAPDLQGSRLAYLPSVPLSALLCLGYASCLEINGKLQYWKIFALTLLLSAAGAALLVNNSAWIKAELSSQAILTELNELSKTVGDKGPIYIVGLPDQINGAYICRNALDGMSKSPQIAKDIPYCFNLDEINHVFPFGYARHTMKNSSTEKMGSKFYVWDTAEQKLKNFVLPIEQIEMPLNLDVNKDALEQGSEIIIDLKDKSCFDLDCLVVNVVFDHLEDERAKDRVCSLFYTNDLVLQFDNAHRLDASFDGNSGEQRLLFPLHGQADWAMGNKAHNLKLVLPKSRMGHIAGISFDSVKKFMPDLSFKANANQSDLGFIELNEAHPSCQLEYDGSKVIGVQKIMLEVSLPDQTFTVINDRREPKSLFSNKELKDLAGSISLNKKDFPLSAIYELRLRVLDGNNKQIGMAGDHIVITVK